MSTQRQNQAKPSSPFSALPVQTGLLQPRPFTDFSQEADEALDSSHQPPDLQTQLDRASRFGHNFSRVQVQAPPSAMIQSQMERGKSEEQEEDSEVDSVAESVKLMAPPGGNPSQQQDQEEAIQTMPLLGVLPPVIQRQDQEEELVQAMPLFGVLSPTIQRQDQEEEFVQMMPHCGRLQRLPQHEDDSSMQMMPQWGVIQRQEPESVEEAIQMQWLQPKLVVGQVGDRYEQEADSVAAQVMSMSAPPTIPEPIQRQSEEEDEQESLVQKSPLADSITPLIQRQTEEQEKQIQPKSLLQRSVNRNSEAGSDLENKLNSSKGGGSPLPDEVRSFMEPRFGSDFSSVRVHTGSTAVQMNKELHAQAFTHGSDIYYGSGKSPTDFELTAHELTHVVQQTGKPKLINNKQGTQFRQEETIEPLQAKKLGDSTAELTQNKTDLNGEMASLASQFPEADAKQKESPQAEELVSHSSEVQSPLTAAPFEANTETENAETETATGETQATSDSQEVSTTANTDSEQGIEPAQDKAQGEQSADSSTQDAATTEKGANDEATTSPPQEEQTGADNPEGTSATAAEEGTSTVDTAETVAEEEKATVEQQAAQAKAEMEGEIASMKAEPLPSLADLLEPEPEGTGEEIDSIVPPTSPQPDLQLPIDTASLTGSGEESELTLPTNLGNQSNFASANATSSQVASNKFKPDLYETSQSSGSTVIQMDLDPSAEQNPDTGYDVEVARSAVRGIAGTIEASSEQARQSIQAQTETVSATFTANAAALSQVIQAQAAQNVASLHEKFAAQRTQLQTLFQATRTQVSTALEARKSEATSRGEQAKTDFTQLFTDHRGQVETAVQDHVTAAEELRTNHETTARERIAAQANEARQRGEAKASGYPGDERGQAQAGAVRKVAEDTAKEIEGRESEVINAIAECTEGIPEEFEKKGQEALQGFDQGLPDLLQGVDEQVQAVINKLTEQADRVYQQLDSLQEQQITQLDASEAAAVSRVQALEPQAQRQIQSGTQMALTALDASAQQAVGQICPFVTQASQTLQSIEAPDVEKANQYAQQVMSFATGASSEVAGGMQEVSNGMAQQSSQTEVAINQSLQQNEQQTNQQLQAITESNQTALSNLVTKVDEGFGQIIQSLDTAFLEVETQIETKLSQALEELVQGFEQKLQEADAKVAEAVNEGLAKNDEALSQLGGKMQEAADEAAWRHDHPVLATLADIGGFVAGLVIGIVAVLALVALVIVGFKVLIAGLVALGVSLVVAKIVAAVVGLGLLAYGIYQAYQARKAASAEGGWSTFGMALLDLTGLTAIHRGVTQEGLSPFQRGLAIGEGVGTLASFFLARGMNRRISNWLPRSITNPSQGSFWRGPGRGIANFVKDKWFRLPFTKTPLKPNSTVVDANVSISVDKAAKGKANSAQQARANDISSRVNAGEDIRVPDQAAIETRVKEGGQVPFRGVSTNVPRSDPAYQNLLTQLESGNVGGVPPKGAADRALVADTFFARTEPGVMPRLITADKGVYTKLAALAGHNPAKLGKSVPDAFPGGFQVTINGRTILVIPVK